MRAEPLRFRSSRVSGFDFERPSRRLRRTVVLLQHSQHFCTAPHCGADCLVGSPYCTQPGGLFMTIGRLTLSGQLTAIEVFATSDVRTLIANHLGISVGRVTDEAHFTNDLGADWLDRLELMMAVEDQFAGVEITDEDVDQIAAVGDLIRHVEAMDNERRRRGVAPVMRNL